MPVSCNKNLKLNLIVPPSPYLIDDLSFPNLGVLYLSAVLKQHNYEVSVIDLHGHADDWNEELIKHADDTSIWGVTCVTPEFPLAVQILKEIRTFYPDARTIIGGSMATCDYHACLLAGFNQVVVGEGEHAILKIMKGSTEKVIKEPDIINLDEIPLPDRNAIDIHRYHYEIDGKNSTNIITSRGCFWGRCRFCCQVWSRKTRYRSPKNVIEELNVIKNMGFDGVMIADDEFFFEKHRDFEICKGLESLDMAYRCLTRSDLIDDEVAEVASRTGCGEILLGIESGSSKILKTINKGVTKEQHEDAIKTLKDYGIKVKALFMIGLPGETRETVEETMLFIEKTQPDICEFTIYTPYPNTVFWDKPKGYDITFDKNRILNGGAWYKGMKGDYVSYVSTSGITAEEIVEIRDGLQGRFGINENPVP